MSEAKSGVLTKPHPAFRSAHAGYKASPHHLHLPHPLPRRLHRNPHVLPEAVEEFEQPPDREIAGAVAHQRRDVRLLDAEHGARLRLRQPVGRNSEAYSANFIQPARYATLTRPASLPTSILLQDTKLRKFGFAHFTSPPNNLVVFLMCSQC